MHNCIENKVFFCKQKYSGVLSICFFFIAPMFFLFFLSSACHVQDCNYSHQGCIYLIKNVVKTVILKNIITISCFHMTSRHCVPMARNADGGQGRKWFSIFRKHYNKLKIPSFMVAQIDQTTRSFYRVPKFVVHKGGKYKKLTEKHWEKCLANLRLRSGGAEWENACVCVCVCRDHFVKCELHYLCDL